MIIKKLKQFICVCAFTFTLFSCVPSDPYEEGSHWDYSISCEGGFKYKTLSQHRGTILLLNSDGTPLRCDKKRY